MRAAPPLPLVLLSGSWKYTHLSSSSCCPSWTRRSFWAPEQPEPGRSLHAHSAGPPCLLSCPKSGLAWVAVVGVCWTAHPAALHRRAVRFGSCPSEMLVLAVSPAVEKRMKSHWMAYQCPCSWRQRWDLPLGLQPGAQCQHRLAVQGTKRAGIARSQQKPRLMMFAPEICLNLTSCHTCKETEVRT